MARVKVFVFTKNEYDTIEDFIRFYGELFGYENVIIIDNKSTDERVRDVYRKYMSLGLVHLYSEGRNMQNHSAIMTEYIKSFKDQCDFVIPLDTDEFIFFTEGGAITKERVQAYFDSIPENVSIIRFKKFLGSCPNPDSPTYVNYKHERPVQDIVDFYDQDWDKIIIRASKFLSSTMGNHAASVTDGIRVVSDQLGLLHFHETGIYRQYERARQGVKGYGFTDPDDHDIVEQIKRCHAFKMGVGGHHCKYFLSFLVRIYFINRWKQIKQDGTLPTAADIEWLHQHREKEALGMMIEDYIKDKKGNTDMNENNLIFGNWPRINSQFVITQVSDFLKEHQKTKI